MAREEGGRHTDDDGHGCSLFGLRGVEKRGKFWSEK